MQLTATITAKVAAHATAANDLGIPAFDLDGRNFANIPLASGIASGQADLIFSDRRSLALSATENLDLAGTLLDPFGGALAMVTVKMIYIRAADANTNDVLVGGAGAAALAGVFGDAATDLIKVKPGGVFLWAAPKTGAPVVATTADLLKVANGGAGTAVTYDVVIIGTSA
jgi:hypothetical protein